MEAIGQYDYDRTFGIGGSLDRSARALEGIERGIRSIETDRRSDELREQELASQLQQRYMAEMRAELAANNANQLYRIAFTLNESNQDLRKDIMRLKNELARLERENRTQAGRANAATTELRRVQEEAERQPVANVIPEQSADSKKTFVEAMKGEFSNFLQEDGTTKSSAAMVRAWDEWVNDEVVSNPKDFIPWVILIPRDELVKLGAEGVPKRPVWLK